MKKILIMSKLFYDHLIVLEELEHHLRDIVESSDEREELWQLIDEIIHHRVLGCILDRLPGEHHDEFIERYSSMPHDNSLLKYINELVEESMEELIKTELNNINEEIFQELLIE